MPVSKARKPFALTALLASTAAATALTGADAHATTAGSPGQPNPVTITASDGTVHEVDTSGTEIGSVHLPQYSAHVAWSGQGGRVAYLLDNTAIWTADYDGSHAVRVANVPVGIEIPALAWDAYSQNIIWAQGLGGNEQLMYASANGDDAASGPHTLVDQATMAKAGIKSIDALDVAGDAAGSMVIQATNSASTGTLVMLLTYGATGWDFTTIATSGAPGHVGQATISPDGTRVVYVSGDQLYLATRTPGGTTWSTGAQVTFAAGPHTNPVFLTDGKTVAFEYQAAGSTTTVTSTADVTQATASANPSEKQLSALTGGLAVRTDAPSHVFRFAGTDRFDTAIQASNALWRNHGDTSDTHRSQAQSVVLARSDVFADALGGAGLAAAKQGPLLLTATQSLTPATQTEIQRILPTGSTVYVLGGTGAIAPAVAGKLTSLGYLVERIGGADRYQTAAYIAGQTVDVPSRILVATGNNYPDALSAGAVAASHPGTVVLLSNDNVMPQATEAYLEEMDTRSNHQLNVWGIGHQGLNALTAAGWSNLGSAAGADRYSTSLLVARDFFPGPDTIGVATGTNFPDALSAGAFLGRFWGPLLLVDPRAGLSADAQAWIDSERGSTTNGFVFGGGGALPFSVDTELAADIRTASGSSVGMSAVTAPAVHASTRGVRADAGTVAQTAEPAQVAKR